MPVRIVQSRGVHEYYGMPVEDLKPLATVTTADQYNSFDDDEVPCSSKASASNSPNPARLVADDRQRTLVTEDMPRMEVTKIYKGRDRWSDVFSFHMAAVGSAAGLGNIWRFPYLVSKHGGLPFIIAYLITLGLIGMPILALELAIGQKFQGGSVEAFGAMSRRLRGIGLASVFGSFLIASFYSVAIAWYGVMFVASFVEELDYKDPTYFFREVLKATYPDSNGNMDSSMMVNGQLLIGALVMWGFIYIAIFKGVRSASIVVKLTVPLSLVILIVLVIRGALLPGAGVGVERYIWQWNSTTMGETELWVEATGQVFFTLSICLGVMTSYASHNPIEQNIVRDEKVISLIDLAMALLSGFVVYEMLGYVNYECLKTSDVSQCDKVFTDTSLVLAPAITHLPRALAQLAGSNLWGVLLFIALLLIGVTSAFSVVEVICCTIRDSWIAKRFQLNKPVVALAVCGLLFLCSFLYMFDTGHVWISIMDRYVNSYGMILIGAAECVAVGWVYQVDKQMTILGTTSVLYYNLFSFSALLIGNILGLGFATWETETQTFTGSLGGVSAILGVMVALIIWLLGLFWAVLYVENSKMPLQTKVWAIVGWHGPDTLRVLVNNKPGQLAWLPMTWKAEVQALFHLDKISMLFGLLIKYFIPAVLFSLFCANVRQDLYKPYEGLSGRYIALGALALTTMVVMMLTVMLFPNTMEDPGYGGDSVWDRFCWMFRLSGDVTPRMSNKVKPLEHSITPVNNNTKVRPVIAVQLPTGVTAVTPVDVEDKLNF